MPVASGAVLEELTLLHRETDIRLGGVTTGTEPAQRSVTLSSTSPFPVDLVLPPENISIEIINDDWHSKRASIPITFTSAAFSPEKSVLLGEDASHLLSMTLSPHAEAGTTLATLTWHLPKDVPAKSLSDILSLIKTLRASKRIRLTNRNGSITAVPHPPTDSDVREIETYISLVEALARVQEKTDTSFPAPREFSQDEANVLTWADHLLQGETVIGTWQQATLTLHPTDNGRDLLYKQARDEVGAYIFAQQQGIRVAGQVIPLGMVGTHLLSGKLSELHDEDQADNAFRITLVPGDSNEYETWLITPEAPINDVIPGVSRRFRQESTEFMLRNDELLRRLARL